jgi:type IV secretory pathway TraG/TraD family ATPase VirD4
MHHRGTVVEIDEPSPSSRHRARPPPNAQLTLAGIPVPAPDELKHFKLLGTTGTGKSTAIRELLERSLNRGDRAVIADPDGAYLNRFYDSNRGDVILNPFDPRSVKWDLFAEFRDPYDFEQLARSLIPDAQGEDRIWQHYAQTFVAAVMRQAHGAGVRDSVELYRLLVTAPMEELRLLLEGTAAQPFLTAGNDRMFLSTRSVTATAVAALRFINSQKSELLSIRKWIQEGRGVLFLPYQAGQIAALRSMISTWMRIAIFETMNLPEGDARLWFVIDELDALGAIDGLKDALARLRKYGGRCVLGFQSIAQVSDTYGYGEADTIVENCGNTLILRCSASEGGGTAQFASKLIGEREVIREDISRTRHPDKWLSTKTTSRHHVTESAVLASEIEQLPDLQGYLKFASLPRWNRVVLNKQG